MKLTAIQRRGGVEVKPTTTVQVGMRYATPAQGSRAVVGVGPHPATGRQSVWFEAFGPKGLALFCCTQASFEKWQRGGR